MVTPGVREGDLSWWIGGRSDTVIFLMGMSVCMLEWCVWLSWWQITYLSSTRALLVIYLFENYGEHYASVIRRRVSIV